MKRILTISPSLCIDCKKCELACAWRHHDAFDGTRARIRVVTKGHEVGVPVICLQCEEAACVTVCPTGALERHNSRGVVELDLDKCIKCRACVAACPFGNITYDEPSKTVQKCDLCGGDPICAVFCPTKAIEYREQEESGDSLACGVAG